MVVGRLQAIRPRTWMTRAAVTERWRERLGGHPVDESHRPHRQEAVAWLERAQDATADDGFARGYSLVWNPYFKSRGWQPSYPETTGYIIPTLYEVARIEGREELRERCERAARWEIDIQLDSGAVRGGVIGQPVSPAVFNTGQVIFGWLSAFEETGDDAFASAAHRAGSYLVSTLDADGIWRRGSSKFARAESSLYNARTAWALAEAGRRLEEAAFTDAASRALRGIAARQAPNGWMPDCCLSDPERPLLHTIAYAVRGLLEGGRVLEEERLVESASVAARELMATVDEDGFMPGRFAGDWSGASTWSCLTGQAQMANIWLRLSLITGDRGWLEPVPLVLSFLKSRQNRISHDSGVRGGIKGSSPVNGGYGRYQVLNWATKFFVDALLRHERLASGGRADEVDEFSLA